MLEHLGMVADRPRHRRQRPSDTRCPWTPRGTALRASKDLDQGAHCFRTLQDEKQARKSSCSTRSIGNHWNADTGNERPGRSARPSAARACSSDASSWCFCVARSSPINSFRPRVSISAETPSAPVSSSPNWPGMPAIYDGLDSKVDRQRKPNARFWTAWRSWTPSDNHTHPALAVRQCCRVRTPTCAQTPRGIPDPPRGMSPDAEKLQPAVLRSSCVDYGYANDGSDVVLVENNTWWARAPSRGFGRPTSRSF